GGILSEGLAFRGADVTGIDMGQAPLDVARAHAQTQNLAIDYRQIPVEQLAAEMPGTFDIITCMEMLEHVPDPASVVKACAALVKPGGHVFFSTLNRNPKAYLLAIVGAEYVLNMVPRGTHDYLKFIKPSELASWARENDLAVKDISGLSVNPLTHQFKVGKDADVNYFMHTQKTS
ncbi:MAG: bifunctional 2-polyprenyl-6-hydroxyphenol methylase/3-demethylubiquinol 3-O-methyltransferase UbiG, partial [Pseudomonadota bacterium]